MCPNCGVAQPAGTQFCTNCGAPLAPPPAAPAEPPPDQPAEQPSIPVSAPLGPGGGYTFGGEPPKPPYPVSLEFSGPEQLSRLSTFFRLVLAIPLLLFLAIIGWAGNGILLGLIVAHWLSLLVRGGRPVGWIGSAIAALIRFEFRAYAYLLLLTDKYPAFEGDWFLQLEMQRPERLQRRQIFFWKTFASIPHILCLIVLWFAVSVCVVIAWFAIVFTGRFPLGLRNFVVGYLRWGARVFAYWTSMRDEFPPFSLSAEATAGSRAATGASAAVGLGGVVIVGVAFLVAMLALSKDETASVSYSLLTQGEDSLPIEVDNVGIQLTDADDSYNFPGDLLVPESGSRFVMIEAEIYNRRIADINMEHQDFWLRDADGERHEPSFVSLGGVAPPADLRRGGITNVLLVFEVGERADPAEFFYSPDNTLKNAKFIFE